jgi:transcriptional regulator with XRE-family HTH domain
MWRKEDVINKLKNEQNKKKLSLRAHAKAIGCSAAYLSDVYNDRREPGKRLLDHLNIERTITKTVVYHEKTEKQKRWR